MKCFNFRFCFKGKLDIYVEKGISTPKTLILRYTYIMKGKMLTDVYLLTSSEAWDDRDLKVVF